MNFSNRKIRPILSKTYTKFLLWNVENPYRVNIGDYSASFKINTRAEYDFLTHESLIGEKDTIKYILKEIKENETFYDIGANIGLYTCLVGHSNDVVAFEPLPANFHRIKENIELNQITENVKVKNKAIFSSTRTVQFDTRSNIEGEGQAQITKEKKDTIDVKTSTLDDFIKDKDTDRPDIIKIDVEGKEVEVIKGARSTLETEQPRLIFIEVHPEKLLEEQIDKLREIIQNSGYNISKIEQNDSNYVLKATSE